jgi:hypothetical protein
VQPDEKLGGLRGDRQSFAMEELADLVLKHLHPVETGQ